LSRPAHLSEEEGLDIGERIARIEDRDEIRQLIARYAHGLDLPDRETFVGVWADDAVYRVDDPFGETVGREAIGAAWDIFRRLFPYMYHHTMNIVVDGPHGNRASATSFAFITGADRSGTAWTSSCTYFDEFARIDGRWLFTRRYDRVNYMVPWLEPHDGLRNDTRVYMTPERMRHLLSLA
jgi:ketosteroid isomerase-like protein